MALVDIITLIERESSEKADSLLETAKTEAVSLVENATVVAKAEAASLEKDGKISRENFEKRKSSEFARNERISVSTAQQEIVDSVFVSAQKELQKLSGDDLIAVFTTLLKKIDSDAGKVLVCGGKVSELESAVKAVKKDFTVSENNDSCGGGFVFVGDGFEMDFSFTSLIEKELRPTKEGEIFKALF